MKFRMILIPLVLFTGMALSTSAAPTKAMALRVKVTVTNGACISGYNWNVGFGPAAFQPVYSKIDNDAHTMEVLFFFTDWSTTPAYRHYLFEVYQCSGPSWVVDIPFAPTNTYCDNTSFYSTDGNVEGESSFAPIMDVTAETPACNMVTLQSKCALENTIWEVSQDPSNPASWKTLRTTGLWEYTTTVTSDDLRAAGFSNPYALTYMRSRDSQGYPYQVAWIGSTYDRSSNVVSFKLLAPPPTASVVNHTDVICKGEANGTATLRISNPLSTINQFVINCKNLDNPTAGFPINNGIVSGDNVITGLKAGRWEFQVINNVDKTQYGICWFTVSHTVYEPDVLSIRFDTPLFNGYAISCNGGSTGQTTAIGQGGVGGYKNFQWTDGPAADTYTGLSAGTYTFSLVDANNCPASAQATLEQPGPLKVTLAASSNHNGYAVSCLNHSDGELTATVTGGAGTKVYSWTNSSSTTNVASNLPATPSYTVTVTDGNFCIATDNKTLSAPPAIDFTIRKLTDLACRGDRTGSFDVTSVANTIGNVTYAWTPSGAGTSISNLGAGTYTLTVSDEQGCSTLKSAILEDPLVHTVSLDPISNYNGSAIKCPGDYNGELKATVRDASGNVVTPQSYRWTRNAVLTGESPSLSSMSVLNSGVYKVVITYNNRCEAEDTQALLDPPAVTPTIVHDVTYNGQLISCHDEHDATLKFSAAGGTGGPASYTYRWTTGAVNTPVLTGLGAGGYGLKVWDVNGCLGRDTITIENPKPVEVSILSFSNYSDYGVSCAGKSDGFVTVEGTGGTETFAYDWTNGIKKPVNDKLAAGDYTVTVTDENGCYSTVSHTVTTPDPLTVSVDTRKDVPCFGGSDGVIALQSHGGAGKYQYSKDNVIWDSPSTFNLPQGNYTLYIKDGNDCQSSVNESLIQPDEIQISFTDIEPAYCSDPRGKATSVVSGGVVDYSYEWRVDGETDVVGTSAILSGVPAGIYRLRVIDAHDCPMENTVPITSTDGAKTSFTSVDTKCFDSADGSAEITITGHGPFVIKWPGGQTTEQMTQLKRGSYNVLITDGHACTVVQPVEVKAPAALSLDIQATVPPTCYGSCNGALTLAAGGGVGGYAYAWNGKTGNAQTQLCAAVYPVVLSDANGCSLSQDVELKQPDPIGVHVVKETLATCRDGCDGVLAIEATGGNGGYGYMWATGDITTTRDNLCPGSYAVDVVDMKGCTGRGTLVLNNTAPLPLHLGGGATLCVGQTQVLDTGPGWTRTTWGSNTGLTSGEQRVSVKEPGSYWVDVLSAKGCIARDTFLLATSFDLLKASFMIAGQAMVGDTVVMIDISWPMPESIAWDFPLEMKEVLNLGDVVFGQFASAGAYDVNLTAHLGECVDQVTKTITILGGEEDQEGGRLGYEAFVKQFELFPNPNDGSFDVGIELAEEGPITLSVWRSENGALVGKLHEEGDHSYKLFFDLRPISSGLYLLRLDHAKGKEYIRFIVH